MSRRSLLQKTKPRPRGSFKRKQRPESLPRKLKRTAKVRPPKMMKMRSKRTKKKMMATSQTARVSSRTPA